MTETIECGVSMSEKAETLSDGKTVWVNAPDGSCIGRFSRFGIDVHRTASDQMRDAPECLDCTHGRPRLAEWRRFQIGMRRHHAVGVGDEHMPAFIRAEHHDL